MELSDSEQRIVTRAERFHKKRWTFAVLFLLLFLVCTVVAVMYARGINRKASLHGLSFWNRFMPTAPLRGVRAGDQTALLAYRTAVDCAWAVSSCTLFGLMAVLSLLTLAALRHTDRASKLTVKMRERLRELGEIE